MKKQVYLILACLVLILVCAGCEKQTGTWKNEVAFSEPLPSIPASYGSLEGVTTLAEYPGYFQLWFEDSEGTIRILVVQPFTNEMGTDVKIIKRSGAVMQGVPKEEVEDEG